MIINSEWSKALGKIEKICSFSRKKIPFFFFKKKTNNKCLVYGKNSKIAFPK
jgi:hypothetical protein